jgi:hypothetical protein
MNNQVLLNVFRAGLSSFKPAAIVSFIKKENGGASVFLHSDDLGTPILPAAIVTKDNENPLAEIEQLLVTQGLPVILLEKKVFDGYDSNVKPVYRRWPVLVNTDSIRGEIKQLPAGGSEFSTVNILSDFTVTESPEEIERKIEAVKQQIASKAQPAIVPEPF